MKNTIDWNTYSPGRPLKAETIKLAEAFLTLVRAEPGIRSAEASSRLGVPSKRGAQLSRSLEGRGLVKVVTGPGYLELHPPED
jgi:hypothetical protein